MEGEGHGGCIPLPLPSAPALSALLPPPLRLPTAKAAKADTASDLKLFVEAIIQGECASGGRGRSSQEADMKLLGSC